MGADPLTGAIAAMMFTSFAGTIASVAMATKGGDDTPAPPQVTEDIGDLSDEEAAGAASRKAMRAETYFTSPTGVLGDAPKRGARLTGL
jgi:hypothetical protein